MAQSINVVDAWADARPLTGGSVTGREGIEDEGLADGSFGGDAVQHPGRLG